MLKLIYHTPVFGPIELEYNKPVIRVGRSEDNDLVLRHPSVEPHHCLLSFQGEKVVWLEPDEDVLNQPDLRGRAGAEFRAGGLMRIGELEFSLAHSANTVAIPEVELADAEAAPLGGESAIGAGDGEPHNRYYCWKCRVFLEEAQAKHIGLVGHTKRLLCPKCSSVLEAESRPDPPADFRKKTTTKRKRRR